MRQSWSLICISIGTVLMLGWIVASVKQYRDREQISHRLEGIFRPNHASAVACPWQTGTRPIMIMVLGQSNAGNHAPEEVHAASSAIFFVDGHCYQSNGPAPGGTGKGGNIWIYLSSLMGVLGYKVVFSVLAVDASSIAEWNHSEPLRDRLETTIRRGKDSGFVPDMVLWQQGESDARIGTTGSGYRQELLSLVSFVRRQGVGARFIAALSTRCRNEGSQDIRTSVRELVLNSSDMALGPDTDSLTGQFRHDGCHFSEDGLKAAAAMWASVIISSIQAKTESVAVPEKK